MTIINVINIRRFFKRTANNVDLNESEKNV